MTHRSKKCHKSRNCDKFVTSPTETNSKPDHQISTHLSQNCHNTARYHLNFASPQRGNSQTCGGFTIPCCLHANNFVLFFFPEKRNRTMGTIFPRKAKNGKPRYLARVRRQGGKHIAKTFETKTEAQAWVASIETSINYGTYSHIAESKKHRVAQLIDHYIFTELPKKPK